MASLPDRTRVIVLAHYIAVDARTFRQGETPDIPTGLALVLAADGRVRLMPWLAPRPARPEPQARRPLPAPDASAERKPAHSTGDPDDEPILPRRAERPSAPAHGRRRPRRAV